MTLRGARSCDEAVPRRAGNCFTPKSIWVRKIIITYRLSTANTINLAHSGGQICPLRYFRKKAN